MEAAQLVLADGNPEAEVRMATPRQPLWQHRNEGVAWVSDQVAAFVS